MHTKLTKLNRQHPSWHRMLWNMLKKICYFVVHILHFFKSEAAGPWDNGPAFINRFKTDVENFLTKPHSAASEKVASYLHHAPRYAFSPQESRKQKGYFDRVGSTTRIGTLNGHKHFFGHSFNKKKVNLRMRGKLEWHRSKTKGITWPKGIRWLSLC